MSIINDETVVDLNQRSDPYTHGLYSRKFTIVGDRFYTIVLSNFKRGQRLTGEIEIDSNFRLIVKPIPAEGTNMQLTVQKSGWSSQTAGGCKNHPSYGVNPAWQINIAQAQDVLFRLVITNQKTPVFTTNPDEFNLCAGVSLFRVNQSYPIAAGKLSLKSLSNANLSTNDGSFTWNLSACVSS